jgi:hypothetical protein
MKAGVFLAASALPIKLLLISAKRKEIAPHSSFAFQNCLRKFNFPLVWQRQRLF